jgi:hypothetical protein
MNRTARTIQLADPLWTALETMSREMGVDRDVLLGQAIFSLARQFGFIAPTQINLLDAPSTLAPEDGAPIEDVRTDAHQEAPRGEEEPETEDGGGEAPDGLEAEAGAEAVEAGGSEPAEDESAGDALAALMGLAPEEAPKAREEVREEVPAPPPLVETGGEKPRAAKPAGRVDRTIIVQPSQALHVQLEQGEPVRITRERFIMGRGSHCDLVVKSAKVSREHAAVVREGAEYFIEDLRSSNGTWFQEARITRRHVSDGDEYLLGGIPVTFSLR